jgi:penicillin-binding protein 2
LASQNFIKEEFYTTSRGEIRDRNGVELAVNRLGFSLYLLPHLKNEKLDKSVENIVKNLPSLDKEKLIKRYKTKNSPYNHRPIEIAEFVPYNEIISKFVILKRDKDLIIEATSKRFYPQGEYLSHVIGYVSKANQKELNASKVTKLTQIVGKSGLERFYNRVLEGTLGERVLKVTALNQTLEILSDIKPKSSDITITVDANLQKYISSLFRELTGAVIVMDVNDGSILAAGSYPEYDNNEFVHGISQKEWQKMINDFNHPFTNKFIHGLYPPGSSTKPQVLLSFLNSKLIDQKEKFLCEGFIKLGDRKFRCWNHAGHGEINGERAIKESCDVYFYKGGLRVGIDKISTDMKRYGFGKKCGVDLPNEFIGTMPSRNWKIERFGKGWNKGETLNTVIGQGDFLTTPLQVATATALIASGKKPIPHFIKKIDESEVEFDSQDVLNSYEKASLKYIREGMYRVCNEKRGTAYKYNESLIEIAGKTGTSQVVGIPQEEAKRMSEDDLKYFKKSHAWFTAYGPYKKPRFVVTVLVEHGGHGGKAAGKLVSQIFNRLVELGYIDKRFVKGDVGKSK